MKLGDIRISRGLLGAAVLLFFLPFITVSCGTQQLSFSGTQMLTGTMVNGEWTGPQFDVVFAFLGAVLALAATLLRGKVGRLLSAIFAAAGFGWLQFFKLRFDAAIGGAQIPLVVSYGPGFWLCCLTLAGAAALGIWALTQRAAPATAPAAPVLAASFADGAPPPGAEAGLQAPASAPATPAGLKACPSCGSAYDQPTRFCMSCGAQLQDA